MILKFNEFIFQHKSFDKKRDVTDKNVMSLVNYNKPYFVMKFYFRVVMNLYCRVDLYNRRQVQVR